MSIDEALRALEKKWRERADHLELVAPCRSEIITARSLRDCAAELAALLTTRQEVAPVAFDAWFSEAFPLTDLEADDGDARASSIRSCARSAWCAGANTATGQTSDARDGARYRWLRDRAINFGLDDEKGTPYCVYGLGAGDATPTDGEELDNMIDHCAAIDAAKRQEGGNG